jgi:phage FluMu protein Com
MVGNIMSYYLGNISLSNKKAVLECNQCNKLLKVPIDKGKLKVKCIYCSNEFKFKPSLLSTKSIASIFLLFSALIFSTIFSYISTFFDISGFYVFLIIPVGAIMFGFIANLGLMAGLAYLKDKGVTYKKSIIITLSIIVALYSFIGMNYISYIKGVITIQYIDDIGNIVEEVNEKTVNNFSFIEYLVEINNSNSFQFFGVINQIPIMTPEIESNTNTVGMTLFWFQLLAAIFALPLNWLRISYKEREKFNTM